MAQTLNELIKQTAPDCPPGLPERVFAAVGAASLRTYGRQRRLWAAISAASLAACAVTGWQAVSAIASSNFGSYASLIFSDGAVALASWKEAGMSLLETLPVAGIGLFLGCIALTLFVARMAVRSAERAHPFMAHA